MKQTTNVPQLFSNKMNTLLCLKDKLSASCILDLYYFTVCEYQNNPEAVFAKISMLFDGEVIVRSSASTEDQYSTNAGHFLSVQHVDSQNKNAVFSSINSVANSYFEDGLTESEFVFVQKQLTDISFAGVALSFEPSCGKPYYLVNYDNSGSTDSVTSGKCAQYMYIARDYCQADSIEARLCHALSEVEKICGNNLNIEFAVTNDDRIFMLQVRLLKPHSFSDTAQETIIRKNTYAANYVSTNEFLSDMAFWNPSEMIGDAPHPLDFSLYDYLVTDSAWNKGIADMGYTVIKQNLMTKIGRKPYIKLRTAFFALTPSTINDALRKKLIEYYCSVLLNDKNLHDKIEFEVVLTCFDFGTPKALKKLENYGFEREELKTLSKALFQMTKSILENYEAILNEDLKKLSLLESSLENCKKQYSLDTKDDILKSIKELMPLIRDYGVTPFSRQARCAFIARALCLSLVAEELIDNKVFDSFMHSLDTVARGFREDVSRCNNNEMTINSFLSKYGHLRSNTYDISSPTYYELDGAQIFSERKGSSPNIIDELSKNMVGELDIKFPQTQIDITDFIRKSIAQRENFKFVFTKVLSYVLEALSELAQRFGISRCNIAYLPLEEIYELFSGQVEPQIINERIHMNKREYDADSLIILPSVVSEGKDFEVINVWKSSPNFITNKCVEGDIVYLETLPTQYPNIDGKIIVIQNADPGFDWIFAKGKIAGLITKYGGMASHMAIRCMEFDIPAAIGCGELIFSQIIRGKQATLDCIKKEVFAR